MDVKISAKNLTVSDRFRSYISERAPKVEQLTHKPQEFSIKVTRRDHSRLSGPEDQVELTVYAAGHIVRAEAHASDKFAAFDVAFGKLTERLRRAGDKRKPHHGRHGSVGASELSATDFADLDITPANAAVFYEPEAAAPEEPYLGESPVIIRRKEFHAEAMSVDDAIEQMELLGHDFFLFRDLATDKESVVYKRRGWNYGVITLV